MDLWDRLDRKMRTLEGLYDQLAQNHATADSATSTRAALEQGWVELRELLSTGGRDLLSDNAHLAGRFAELDRRRVSAAENAVQIEGSSRSDTSWGD
jgi:hypothetical protein